MLLRPERAVRRIILNLMSLLSACFALQWASRSIVASQFDLLLGRLMLLRPDRAGRRIILTLMSLLTACFTLQWTSRSIVASQLDLLLGRLCIHGCLIRLGLPSRVG